MTDLPGRNWYQDEYEKVVKERDALAFLLRKFKSALQDMCDLHHEGFDENSCSPVFNTAVDLLQGRTTEQRRRTKNQWVEKCAAQFVARANLTSDESVNQARYCAANEAQDNGGDVSGWQDPSDAANNEMDDWYQKPEAPECP